MGLNLCDSCRTDCRHERNPREIVIKCGAYTPPMTNADRIRAMSDEELARFLAEVEYRRSAAGGGAIWKGMAHALEWLQQPTEEDDI